MEMITEYYLTVAIIAYLVGSIPFGLIVTKMAGKGDIRAIGSSSDSKVDSNGVCTCVCHCWYVLP